MDQLEKDLLIKKNKTSYFNAGNFSFLKDHKSLRPGKKHLLLGTPGSGKSTLARSICDEIAKSHKVMWYSSEEDLEDAKTALSFSNTNDDILKNIEFREESNYLEKHKGKYNNFLAELLKDFTENQCEVLFFDNLTTSAFYDNRPLDEQSGFFNLLSDFFREVKKPLFLIAHTDGKTKDLQKELFDANSIRGQKLPANKCEYIYAYQIITWDDKQEDHEIIDLSRGEKKSAFVRVVKSRSHPNGGRVYALVYDNDSRSYLADSEIEFSNFADIYSKRVKLK